MSDNKRFFGLHLDFHADNTTEIGIRTTAEDIERYITAARPDFIQCDCKGHSGNSCYPTKVGNAAKMLRADNLRVFTDTAKKCGIPIYVHYSGVYEVAYTQAHPEDAQCDEQGKPTENASLFGNYVHDLLIPQMKELITEYGIDGAWVDGECWSVYRDYSPLAKPYLKDGITREEHNEVMREAFRRYVATYVDELHAFAPNFKITSNWMYATHMPERPTVNIDFISGDYAPNDSLHKARYDARIAASQGKPWDLMAWSFEWSHFVDKPAVQLMQEAAGVLSLGGGFQLYINQNPDGSVRRMSTARLTALSEFVHARRFLFEKAPTSDTAVLLSTKSYYKHAEIFNQGNANACVIGALNSVLDAGLTASILLEYQTDRLDKYRAIIVPEWDDIEDAAFDALIDYAKRGGKLIVMGAATVKRFAEAIGTEVGDVSHVKRAFLKGDNGEFHSISNLVAGEEIDLLDLTYGDEVLYANNDERNAFISARRTDSLGLGSITYIPFNFGSLYFCFRSRTAWEFVKKAVLALIKPTVTVNRSGVDVTFQQDGNALLINLVNMNQGRHSLDYLVYDEIPAICDLTVRVSGEYGNVVMPLGESFEATSFDGETVIKLDRLDIHTIISLEK